MLFPTSTPAKAQGQSKGLAGSRPQSHGSFGSGAKQRASSSKKMERAQKLDDYYNRKIKNVMDDINNADIPCTDAFRKTVTQKKALEAE